MSDAQEAPKLSLMDQFKQQKEAFVQQGNQLQVQFQQIQGAIFACDQMIQKMEAEAVEQLKKLAEETQKSQGEESNGEAVEQEQGQAPQE